MIRLVKILGRAAMALVLGSGFAFYSTGTAELTISDLTALKYLY